MTLAFAKNSLQFSKLGFVIQNMINGEAGVEIEFLNTRFAGDHQHHGFDLFIIHVG
jgi:hypothetical protein